MKAKPIEQEQRFFFSRFNLCAHTTCSSEESGRSLRDQRAGWLYFAWVLYWKYSIKLNISEHIACTRCSHPREPFPFLPGAFYCGQCFLRDFRIDSQQCLQPISSFSPHFMILIVYPYRFIYKCFMLTAFALSSSFPYPPLVQVTESW